jgi:hypothetical protein
VQIIARAAKMSGFFDASILSSKERNRSMSFLFVSWTHRILIPGVVCSSSCALWQYGGQSGHLGPSLLFHMVMV